VKAGNVYALNGNAYFSRPGPRLVNGLEMIARLLHAQDAAWSLSPTEAVRFH
jgi:iron complex transport system substrate-binding protein